MEIINPQVYGDIPLEGHADLSCGLSVYFYGRGERCTMSICKPDGSTIWEKEYPMPDAVNAPESTVIAAMERAAQDWRASL
ncbi:hypothetical protein [Sphingosinicella xenopeptidilytica]|uniref:Uncharacterized protein n=1 Tax=Sphingosinicella xenopeptidilytica TaxID=364098 RepID=A0ABW3C188_SPHXN